MMTSESSRWLPHERDHAFVAATVRPIGQSPREARRDEVRRQGTLKLGHDWGALGIEARAVNALRPEANGAFGFVL